MLVAAVYDIHGNLPALEAVLAEVRALSVDHVVVGGDVFPGPLAPKCLDLLRSLDRPTSFIRGNGDRVVIDLLRGQEPAEVPPAYREPIRWNAKQLSAQDATWVQSWPETVRVNVDGFGDVLFCHATPRNDW